MKFPRSTLSLLQFSAAASAVALDSRQLDPVNWEKDLMHLCVPGFNSTEQQERDTPCFQAPDLAYECTFGKNSEENTPLKEQQDCICKSELWDLYKGCATCFRLHGGMEGRDFAKDEFYDAASSSFCNAEPTVQFAEFLVRYEKTAAVTTAKTSESDVLGTQTDVSLYYTADPTGTIGTGVNPTADQTKDSTAEPPATGGLGVPAPGSAYETPTGTAPANVPTGAASTLQRDGGLLAPVAGAILAMGLF